VHGSADWRVMSSSITGPSPSSPLGPMAKPQSRPHADKPGCYDLVFRRPRSEIAAGEDAELDVYITGYGAISGAKLYFVPPTSFIKPGSCIVEHSLGQKEDGSLHWGNLRMNGADDGLTIDLSSGGMQQPGWSGPSLFFDSGGGIVTEKGTPEPPVKVRFQVQEKASTGDHGLNFVLTYFNGREWQISNRIAILHVPTLYERYEGPAWAVGAAIAVITMITSIVAILVAIGGSSSSATVPAAPASHHVKMSNTRSASPTARPGGPSSTMTNLP